MGEHDAEHFGHSGAFGAAGDSSGTGGDGWTAGNAVALAIQYGKPPKKPPADQGKVKPRTPAKTTRGLYVEKDGCLCRNREGEPVPLCNFVAHIVEQVIHDNGEIQEMALALEGRLNTGQALPRIDVTATSFAGLAWVTQQWGCGAIIYAGTATKDHLRVALQELSGDVPRRTVYSHIGWRQFNGQWRYLHAGGALGADGNRVDVEVTPGAGHMRHYRLPDPPAGAALRAAVSASLALADIAPHKPEVGALLLACIYRAPLAAVALIDHAAFLVGFTGARKSEAAAMALAHFGQGFIARTFPASWKDTVPAMEVKAHAAKDAIIVVDDFKPTGSKKDVDELHKKAEDLFRGAGNQSGRGRLSPTLKQRATYHPRGLVLATGEDIREALIIPLRGGFPKGQSLRARITVTNLSRNASDPRQGDIDLERLSLLQRHAGDGTLSQAMAGYLCWLAPQMDHLRECLPEEIRALRDQANRAGMQGHSRTPSDFASLVMGITYLARFAEACQALDAGQAKAFQERATAALRGLLEEQAEHQASQDDVTRFLALLASALSSGRCHVFDLQGSGKGCPTDKSAHSAALLGWRDEGCGVFGPQGTRVGWLDSDVLYLDGEAAYAVVVRYAGEQGGAVELTQPVLFKRIHERGLLARTSKGEGCRSLQIRKRVAGSNLWLYALRLSVLLNDEP